MFEQAPAPEVELKSLFAEEGEPAPPVAILLSSPQDRQIMQEAEEELTRLGIQFETRLMELRDDAHKAVAFAEKAAIRGVRVIIVSGGFNAALATLVATFAQVPVIGVPLPLGPLAGVDALLAMSQCSATPPIACMAIGGARNSAEYASEILGALPMPPGDVA